MSGIVEHIYMNKIGKAVFNPNAVASVAGDLYIFNLWFVVIITCATGQIQPGLGVVVQR
jgi:hypothetical protein